MERVLTNGVMVECFKENIKMTEKMVEVFIFGQMEELIMENGKMESNMDLVSTLFLILRLRILKSKRVNGLMEKDKNGEKISLTKKFNKTSKLIRI